eukprot:GHVS01021850.1.p1 GENE.GHVS01021850.1~~GHVS01021850.1.p1  ORF type:complete len:268 (+),score=76.59 GHVS01021850.1:366-1169(+)
MVAPPDSPSPVVTSSPFHLPPLSFPPPVIPQHRRHNPPVVPPLYTTRLQSPPPYSKQQSAAPPPSSHRTSRSSSSLSDSSSSPLSHCCRYLSHLFCGSGSLCHPVRCVIDQNEVEVVPGTARTNMTTSRSSRPDSTSGTCSSARSPPRNNNGAALRSPSSAAFRTPIVMPLHSPKWTNQHYNNNISSILSQPTSPPDLRRSTKTATSSLSGLVTVVGDQTATTTPAGSSGCVATTPAGSSGCVATTPAASSGGVLVDVLSPRCHNSN